MKKIVFLWIILGSLWILNAQEKCCPMMSARQSSEKCNFDTLGNKVICPITGEKFNITKDSDYIEYKGKLYFFCCPGCKEKFKSNPEKYL
ncbi:MAG: YHS domain-containing protein, partial [Candidatus Omnitrophica bacterium]|nr:YHS domain-containing protein [Candidatus Omnitrophota bacterium]